MNISMFRRSDSRTRDDGFTLIELLVVVAIIAILTTIVTVGVMGALKDSRDKKRIAGLEQVRLALEVYREAHGEYPARGSGASAAQGGCTGTISGAWSGHGVGSGGSLWGNCDEYILGLGNILTLPVDPNNDVNGYIYSTDGNDYKLMSYNVVESEVIAEGHPYARYPASCNKTLNTQSTKSYAVYSKGAECW